MSVPLHKALDHKVLILPPTRRDGQVTSALLKKIGLVCETVATAKSLAAQIDVSTDAVVLTDAVSNDPDLDAVFDAIERQPSWSDVPIVLLSGPITQALVHDQRFGKLTNVTLLDRPTSSRALVSAVEAAIRGRERQYQIRDQLDSLRTAETALRESAERMALGVQVAGLALAEIDYAVSNVYLSAEAASLFGLAEEARTVSNVEFLAAVHPDDREEVSSRLLLSAEASLPNSPSIDYRVVWPDGRIRWVSQRHMVVAGNTAGRRKRAMIVALDATERKNADRRKDEFLATLAHELRNPLAPIRTGLQALARFAPDDASGANIRKIMERQLAQMVRLIDDLLDVSRISSGKVVLQRHRLDLRAVTELAVEASQPFISAGHHELTINLPNNPLWMEGDASRLSQIIVNLLNNAAKYTADHGEIILTLAKSDDYALLQVEDNGVGIPPEMLGEVFEMFTQVNRTLDRAQGGLGIGLSLVRRLAQLHGGDVSAVSAGLGRGSLFTVRLPMANVELVHAPAPQTESKLPAHRRLRILVIDDIQDVADSMAILLELGGYDTKAAYSGVEGLAIAAAFKPHVVICDIGLPEMDGHAIARRLRADPATASATLIALTGWGAENEVRRTRDSGFNFHLVKPVDESVLNQLLSQVQPECMA